MYNPFMINFDAIIKAARALDEAERLRLARMLLAETRSGASDDDAAVGRRGLASLTASTREEDWSDFYPPELQSRKAS